MQTIKYLLFTSLLLTQTCLLGQSGNSIFDETQMHDLRLYFFQDDFFEEMDELWDVNHTTSGINVPYTKAFMQIDGNWLDTVGIRIKGLSSYYKANDKKKPFKIDLNEFTDGQKYDGMKKFNLHNGACDPAMMRDLLAYDILRKAGVAAPRVSHCRLYFNDEYWGVYSIIEQIDKTFLKDNFTNDNGTLIKNTGWDELLWKGPFIDPYLEDYEMKTNEDVGDWSDFLNFVDVLNHSSDAEFPEAIQEIFDVDQYLHVMAVDIMTNNWDSYIDGERNWYLYHEPTSGQFHWIPWDYNLSLGGALTVDGNPYPPFDSTCYVQATFSHAIEGDVINFINESVPQVNAVFWDFGDGQFSTEMNPSHIYTTTGTVNVCLTAHRADNNQVCENTRCKEVNLDFSPGDCNSILNGSSPYPANDPIFQLVTQLDEYCCEGEWDAFCSLHYYEISNSNQNNNIGSPGVPYDLTYPLIIDNEDKVLIDRLMNVPEFRQRYLDIVCYMLDNNFNEERLFAIIDAQSELIRPAIEEDPNYIFTHDFFEYDVGNGTGGGGDAEIPALKWLLGRRFTELEENLTEEGHDCNNAFSSNSWHDVVINEFAASNIGPDGIADPAGEFGDWIELYNNTEEAISLDNFYLSDELETPLRWTFPLGTVIEANDYLIVWADKDEAQDGLHTNFRLSKSGEFIMLGHEDGTIIDSLSFGEQTTNLPSARLPNGTGPFYQQAPTFGLHNGNPNSTGEEMAGQISIFPNPANEQLIIDFGEIIMKKEYPVVSLHNALGQNLASGVVGNSQKLKISTSHLPAGYYFLKIYFENETGILKQVIIDH